MLEYVSLFLITILLIFAVFSTSKSDEFYFNIGMVLTSLPVYFSVENQATEEIHGFILLFVFLCFGQSIVSIITFIIRYVRLIIKYFDIVLQYLMVYNFLYPGLLIIMTIVTVEFSFLCYVVNLLSSRAPNKILLATMLIIFAQYFLLNPLKTILAKIYIKIKQSEI